MARRQVNRVGSLTVHRWYYWPGVQRRTSSVFQSSAASALVDPAIIGIGPEFTIPAVLEKANVAIDEIGIYEIYEAFASQATMPIQHVKIPIDNLSPKGGAIALGHPFGCTGTRHIATLLLELKRQNKKTFVLSMCIARGMAAAAVIGSVQ